MVYNRKMSPSPRSDFHPHPRLRRRPPRRDSVKTALVVLWSAALAFLVLTFIAVFYPPGEAGPTTLPFSLSSSTPGMATTTATTTAIAAQNPAPTSSATSSAGATSTVTATAPGEFASEYSTPPVAWQDSGAQFSLTGASLSGNELTLTLAIQIGDSPACIPANLRLVANETGALRAPDSPAGGEFTFPDTQSCNGTPGAVYSASVTFSVDGVAPPYLLTTGGAANQYFFAATSTDGGVNISLPATQG